jgi:glycine cleavage system regulatory protein
MRTDLVVTVVGADRPGLVEALAKAALAHDANWEGSRMVRLAGRFAGVVQLTVEAERVGALEHELAALQTQGLRLMIERGDPTGAGAADTTALRLELVGNDRPGILREIARALAARHVNVEELETECVSAPMSGDTLFKATARLRCAAGSDTDELRDVLEAIGDDLMVDVRLDAPDR